MLIYRVENLTKRPRFVKDVIEQMKHSIFEKEDEAFTKFLNTADESFFKNNIHVNGFYFGISAVAVILGFALIHISQPYILNLNLKHM